MMAVYCRPRRVCQKNGFSKRSYKRTMTSLTLRYHFSSSLTVRITCSKPATVFLYNIRCHQGDVSIQKDQEWVMQGCLMYLCFWVGVQHKWYEASRNVNCCPVPSKMLTYIKIGAFANSVSVAVFSKLWQVGNEAPVEAGIVAKSVKGDFER